VPDLLAIGLWPTARMARACSFTWALVDNLRGG